MLRQEAKAWLTRCSKWDFRTIVRISYDRVMSISTDVANSVCNRFEQEGVACPPLPHGNVFITAAMTTLIIFVAEVQLKILFMAQPFH